MDAHFEPPSSNISQRLKDALEMRDMTAASISRATGLSRSAISHYLKGTYEPKQDKIFLLSRALRVNPAWLMGFDVDMEKDAPAPVGEIPVSFKADTSRKIQNLRDTIHAQQNAINNLVVLVDEVDASLHPAWQEKIAQWAGKYARLSNLNQQIINTTIDTMLKTQLATSTEDDARASANEKARPGTGELYEERYPNVEEVETMKLPKKMDKGNEKAHRKKGYFYFKSVKNTYQGVIIKNRPEIQPKQGGAC